MVLGASIPRRLSRPTYPTLQKPLESIPPTPELLPRMPSPASPPADRPAPLAQRPAPYHLAETTADQTPRPLQSASAPQRARISSTVAPVPRAPQLRSMKPRPNRPEPATASRFR